MIGSDGGSGSGFSTTTVVVCCLGASGVAVGYLWKVLQYDCRSSRRGGFVLCAGAHDPYQLLTHSRHFQFNAG